MKAALPVLILAAALAAGAGAQQPPQFQWPEKMQNAQVLPADIGAERLRDTMRTFAISLGVRCTHCHEGAEGAPLHEIDFASDANPHKEAARGMMRMVWQLNRETLPAIPGLHEPRVTCFTCHRGATQPATTPPPPPAPQPPPQGERGGN